MKRFTIPLVEKCFIIYCGKEEWEKFRDITNKEGANGDILSPSPKRTEGRYYGGRIWVYDIKDKKTLLHELSHLIDDAMLTLNSDDTEFRAYLTEWVYMAVLKYSEST